MTIAQRLIFFILILLYSCNETQTETNSHANTLSVVTIDSSGLTAQDNISGESKPTMVFHVEADSITIGQYKGGRSCGGDAIYFNNKLIFCGDNNDFVYDSEYNRVMLDNNQILLFIEVNRQPSFNQIAAYSVNKTTARLLIECVYNDKEQRNGQPPFTDMDKDGYLEFGGFDWTEQHPSPDSMYYIPSEYYEVKNGTVTFDSVLTKTMDIKENGIYLKQPFDNEGNCCKVIPKPKRGRNK